MNTSSHLFELIRHLLALIHGRRIYPPRHPVLERSLTQLEATLRSLMADRQEIQLGVLGRRLIADGLPWEEQGESHAALAQELKSRGVEKLTFLEGVTRADLEGLMEALCPGREEGSVPSGEVDSMADWLQQRGVRHVRVSQLDLEPDPETSERTEVTKDNGAYQEAVDGLAETMHSAKEGRTIRLQQVQNLVGLLIDHLSRDPGPLLMLTALKKHSDYTFVHIVNVTILTLAQIQAITEDREIIREYGIAAMMHDMGKMRIPQEILTKTEPLTKEEFAVIQQHPIDTLRILRETPGMTDLPLIVGFEHHRRYDLTGYPSFSHPCPQHFASRMCALADAYDAIRSHRTYQRGRSPKEAMEILHQQAGKMFDPVLVRLFKRMIGVYPPGTRVQLDTGEEAMVLRVNPADPARPFVRILRDDLSEEEFFRPVDLTARHPRTGAYLRTVKGSVSDTAQSA